MFDNNGHVFLIREGENFQVYIWVQGMKYKLHTVDIGLELVEANNVAEQTAESLKIPYRRFKPSEEMKLLGISNVEVMDEELQVHFDCDGVRYAYDLDSRINLDSPTNSINFVYNSKVKDIFTKKEENSKSGNYYKERIEMMNKRVDFIVAAINRFFKEA